MKKFGILLTVLLLIGIASLPNTFAHYPTFPVQTVEDILDFCEFYYDEYLYMGMENLLMQHPGFPNLRACGILYDHVAWSSTHPGRDLVLLAEIEKYLGDSRFVMERHLREFTTMPDWVKRDAQLWVSGMNKDSQYAYGIRAMLENKVLSPVIIDNTVNRNCDSKICLNEGDYVKYRHSNKYGDIVIERFEIIEKKSEQILISVQQTTSEKRQNFEFYLDYNLHTSNTEKCCNVDKFIFKIPLEFEDTENTYNIVGKTTYPINKISREGVIAQTLDENHILVIDRETGLLLSAKHVKEGIVDVWEKTSLIETNVFQKSAGIKLENMKIPKWWKTSTMWFLEGKFSETEYLQAMEFLIEKNILRV